MAGRHNLRHNTHKTILTPTTIEYLFQKVRQFTSEREYEKEGNCLATTKTFLDMIPQIPPTLTEEIIEEFERDCEKYTRY